MPQGKNACKEDNSVLAMTPRILTTLKKENVLGVFMYVYHVHAQPLVFGGVPWKLVGGVQVLTGTDSGLSGSLR